MWADVKKYFFKIVILFLPEKYIDPYTKQQHYNRRFRRTAEEKKRAKEQANKRK